MKIWDVKAPAPLDRSRAVFRAPQHTQLKEAIEPARGRKRVKIVCKIFFFRRYNNAALPREASREILRMSAESLNNAQATSLLRLPPFPAKIGLSLLRVNVRRSAV